jgi:hypothetical protein
MINTILGTVKDVSLAKEAGKFVSDKSYAYDTIFFMSKFILANLNSALIFNKKEKASDIEKYIKDIFQLTGKASGAMNYMNEALNILMFSNVIRRINNDEYKVEQLELMEYIVEKIENAYIFLYLVVYKTFENDELLGDYRNLLNEQNISKKETLAKDFRDKFVEKSPNIGQRKGDEDTVWSNLSVKYPLIILGYANNDLYISRNLKYKDGVVDTDDISINVPGTKTDTKYPKKNDYIKKFDGIYARNSLGTYLITKYEIDYAHKYHDNNIASDLADLKIEILEQRGRSRADKYQHPFERQQYVEKKVKLRNQSIHSAFKNSLINSVMNKCPICQFEFRELLIASHIIPYTKCEDTYDAINENNGLLLCPNHDRLFEAAKYMTIDANTGEIILSKKVAESKDYGNLKGTFIDKSLVMSERKHYLKWHNDEFRKLNTEVQYER